jgi:hypothetical protein
MSDPDIIKSSTPHRVSIAEGSSNAVGKKAEVGEASIRKVLSDASGELNEITINEDELKGKKTPLSLDEEIALAKKALEDKKELRAKKEPVRPNDELRAEKAGVKTDKDLRAEKAPVSLDDILKGPKEGVTLGKDLRAEKAGVDPSGDLRAEKEAVTSNKDLRGPKENAKADTDLRAPKEGVKTISAAALASLDSLVTARTASSATEGAASENFKESETQAAAAPSNEATSTAEQKATSIEPEMDFPARVVHLKIENDNLRGALDKLESAP